MSANEGRLLISPLKTVTTQVADTRLYLSMCISRRPHHRISLRKSIGGPGFSRTRLIWATHAWPKPAMLWTRRQLGWLASWHLREETYGRALARGVDAEHSTPLGTLFGAGTSSSSDGQNFPLDRRPQATGAVNPHKGADPAVSYYSHVSDRYALFHSAVISALASEAAQVLDGLLHHGADLHIQEHHRRW